MKPAVVAAVIDAFHKQYQALLALRDDARYGIEVQVHGIRYELLEPQVRLADGVLVGVDLVGFETGGKILPPLMVIAFDDIAALGFTFPVDWEGHMPKPGEGPPPLVTFPSEVSNDQQ